MHRPRFTVPRGKTKRWIALTVPAVILGAGIAVAFFNAQRVLNRSTVTVAGAHLLEFSLQQIDTASGQYRGPNFEPVASLPAYTSGIVFEGNLYLAGQSGLTLFGSDGTPIRVLTAGRELPVSPVVALGAGRLRGDSEAQLLLATAGAGLLILRPNGKAPPTVHQLLPLQAEARDLTALLPMASGDLLLGTRHRGVLLFNGTTLKPVNFILPGIDSAILEVTSLVASDAASYLIGTRNDGIFYSHAGMVEHASAASGLPDDEVESIAVEDGHAFVGTPVGTAEFDLGAASFRPVRILAPGVFSHALSVQSDRLQIGTLDQGIVQVPLDSRASLRRASISAGPIEQSSQRIDGFIAAAGVFYAIGDGALLRRGERAWAQALPPAVHALSDRNISALAFAPDGSLYVGFFDHGLDILDADSGSPVRHIEDDHLFCVNRLVLDPERQTMAAATANGLVLFDAQGRPRQTLGRRDGLISEHVTDIAFTRAGMAVATPAGITFVGPSGTESLYAFQGLTNNHVYALAASGDQVVAGTLGGLSILQSASVRRNLTVQNSGLKHNWITALLATPDGGYLLGTYGAGLQTMDRGDNISSVELPAGAPRDLVINPNALFATSTHVYAGTLGHGVLVYSVASGRWSVIGEGLPSLNVTAFAARAGELYIGTENGLVRTREADLP